jgi:hypothetical protein
MYSSLLKIEVIQYASDVLTKRWYYVTDTDGYASGHWAHPYDIDGDGKDEILSRDVLDDDGTRLGILPMRDISGGMDHPDSIVVADIDPTNEGVEIALACQTGLHLFSNNINTTPDPDEFIELWTCEQSEGGCVPEPQETTVGNFRTDVSGLEIVFFAEGMSGTNSVRMYKYDETILKSGNQASTGPKRLITHNMDWDGDRSVDEIYSRNGIWNFNFAKISESMNWSWVNSIDTDEWPPVITDIRETTDHREEILFYDMDEIVIIQNSDTLGIDSEPSPWTDAGYRFKMANTNHGNHYYFNWLTLYSPNPRRGNVILSGVKNEKILFAIYIFAFLFPVMYFRHR